MTNKNLLRLLSLVLLPLQCYVPLYRRKWPLRMRCVTWPVGRGPETTKNLETLASICLFTIQGLRWWLRVVYTVASTLWGVFGRKFSKSENGPKNWGFGGLRVEISNPNNQIPLGNQSPPKYVIWRKTVSICAKMLSPQADKKSYNKKA